MFGPLGMLGMERSLPETQDSDSEHLTENNEDDPQDQQLDLILDDANIAVEVTVETVGTIKTNSVVPLLAKRASDDNIVNMDRSVGAKKRLKLCFDSILKEYGILEDVHHVHLKKWESAQNEVEKLRHQLDVEKEKVKNLKEAMEKLKLEKNKYPCIVCGSDCFMFCGITCLK